MKSYATSSWEVKGFPRAASHKIRFYERRADLRDSLIHRQAIRAGVADASFILGITLYVVHGFLVDWSKFHRRHLTEENIALRWTLNLPRAERTATLNAVRALHMWENQ